MNKNLNLKQVLFVYSIVLIFLVTLASLAYNRLVLLVETNEALSKNNDFVLKLEEVISYLKDAETGERGYLLTSDTIFLEPQRYAGTKVYRTLQILGNNAKNIGEQIPYLDSINRMAKMKINLIWDIVGSVKSGETAKMNEHQIAMIGKGRIIMDSLRNTIQNLQNLEQKRLNINTKKQAEFANSSPRFLLIIIITAISVIIITMWAIECGLKKVLH